MADEFDELPLEVDEKPAPAKTEPSEIEKRLAALEAENKSYATKIKELSESERYWASRAKGGDKPAPEPEADDEEDEDGDEKPEKLLDDLSTKGMKAIRERGFVTEKDVRRMVDAKVNATLEEVTTGQAFDAKLAADFPELKDPNSELFKRAGKHFKDMNEIDPKAKNSRVALYSAAKLAKAEIDSEKKMDKENKRRDRIESQAPERTRGREEEGGDEPELSAQSRQIIKNFERFGVTEESYLKNAKLTGSGRRNGR